jgi:hypothetical protein
MQAVIQFNDVKIAEDNFGRYRLNDLHKLSGNEPRHRPSEWLKLIKTQELIDIVRQDFLKDTTGEISLVNNFGPLISVEGASGGTFAIKKLVYAYATWISPIFFSHVLDVFEKQQKEEVERRENMTEVEILRENAKLTLRLADEIEKKQQLNDRISSGALFDKLNLVNDTRSVISIEDIRLNYFFGFSNLVIDQFLRYINHPKREMVVADRFPKNMYIDENLFEAAHRLWEECEKIKNKKYVELYHKSFIDRKAFMPIDIAKEVWGYGLT